MIDRYQIYPSSFRAVHRKVIDLSSIGPTAMSGFSRTSMVVEASRSKFYIFTIRSSGFTLDTIEVSVSIFDNQIISCIVSIGSKYVIPHIKKFSDDVCL